MNDNKMITQSRIIEEYGWTKSLISKFLPDPVLKANPHYRKAAPMRLWDEDTVKQVMTTSEFKMLWRKLISVRNQQVKQSKLSIAI